jgi:hypothetical protein
MTRYKKGEKAMQELNKTEGLIKTHRRQRVTVTLHPQTVLDLEALSEKYKVPWGRLIDRFVASASQAVKAGKQYCIFGGQCPIGKSDIPEVL